MPEAETKEPTEAQVMDACGTLIDWIRADEIESRGLTEIERYRTLAILGRLMDDAHEAIKD